MRDETPSDESRMGSPLQGNVWGEQIRAAAERADAAEVRLAAQAAAARVLLRSQEEAASVLLVAQERAATVLLVAEDEARAVLRSAYEKALDGLLANAKTRTDVSYTSEGEMLVRFDDTANALELAHRETAAALVEVHAVAADILVQEQRKAAATLSRAREIYAKHLADPRGATAPGQPE